MRIHPITLPQEETVSVPEAFWAPTKENDVQRQLRQGLARLGPNGEYWGKGNAGHYYGELCNGRLCALLAIKDLGENFYTMKDFMALALGKTPECNGVAEWNDLPTTTFADVRAMFLKAISLAGGGA